MWEVVGPSFLEVLLSKEELWDGGRGGRPRALDMASNLPSSLPDSRDSAECHWLDMASLSVGWTLFKATLGLLLRLNRLMVVLVCKLFTHLR